MPKRTRFLLWAGLTTVFWLVISAVNAAVFLWTVR